MESFFVKNSQGQRLAIDLRKSENQKGLAFIMPGLGATKNDKYLKYFVDIFLKKNFTVVTFDVRHGVGESDGDYSQASFTSYYDDLCDVIDWAEGQDWYQEPFVLAGHSMGSGCILWYGANHPEKLAGIAPLSTVIGGKQTLARFANRDTLPAVEKKGNVEVVKKLNWISFVKDILKYDIVPRANKFTMPVLMAVGDQDNGTPLEDQMKLYDKMPEEKEIHVIKGASHTFKEDNHLSKIKEIFDNWIDNQILN